MSRFSVKKAKEILKTQGQGAQFEYCFGFAEGNNKDADALACLGHYYHNAEEPERNLQKAETCYREAALSGCKAGREGLFALGCQYMYVTVSNDGNSITLEEEMDFPLDLKKAESILMLCNQFEDARLSCFIAPLFVWLGNYYESGWNGVKQNSNKALKCYKFAADKQDAEGQFSYADLMAYGDCDCNDPESFKYYQLSADQGYVPAMLRLSRFISHFRHKELPPILSKWTIALLIGIVFMIPAVIMDGISSEYHTQAPQWVEMGMQLTGKVGTIASCYLAIVLIAWGLATKNKWLLTVGMSFAMMLPTAIIEAFPCTVSSFSCWQSFVFRFIESVGVIILFYCGFKFFRFMNPASDYKLAFSWIEKAADTGDPEALYKKASALFYGNGVKKDPKEAIKYYKEAAKKGNSKAKIALGHLYRFGRQVPKDYTRSYQLFREAADTGDCDGQYMVGYCYEHGIGVAYDMEEARTWYRLGRENGSTLAHKRLNKPLKPSILDYLMRRTPSYSAAEIENEKLRIELGFTKKERDDAKQALADEKETNKRLTEKIEKKIDDGFTRVENALNALSTQLETAKQELIQKVDEEHDALKKDIDNASESLLSTFFEYCKAAEAATIAKAQEKSNEGYYTQAKERLKKKFGDTWKKLDQESQISLISAHVLLDLVKADSLKSTFDYSGIAISASSALENELTKHFFNEFIRILKEKQVPKTNWPEKLIQKEKDFTLGDFRYLVAGDKDTGDKKEEQKERRRNRDMCLQEILKKPSHFHLNQPNEVLIHSLRGQSKSFVDLCDHIRREYRNPSAHAQTVGEAMALSCCELIMGRYDAEEKLNSTESVLILLFELLK